MYPWVSKYLLYLPVQALRREPVLRPLRDLERSQWEAPEELRRRQSGRLREVLGHAQRHVPYYRELFAAQGLDATSVRRIDDLPRLPLLEKETIRAESGRLVSEASRARLDLRRTSGSTGVPLPVPKSREAAGRIRAIWYRYLRWYGVDIGQRQGRFLGHPVSWKGKLKEDVQDFILNKSRLDPVFLTPERMRAYWRSVLRRPPTHLYGYPSAMVTFARFLREEGEDPRRAGIGVLVCTGETLYSFQRDELASAFDAAVVNEYGCTESGVIAFPCPEEGRMHLSAENLIVEFLTEKGPARPGEPGEVVLTELYRPDAPLIRYRLGDTAVPGDGSPCPCGRGLPTIEKVEGRSSQMIRLADGRLAHSEVFAYISDAISAIDPAIGGFRVGRVGNDEFRVFLLAPGSLRDGTEQRLREMFQKMIGETVGLSIEQVAELPRDPSGKLRYFIEEQLPRGAGEGGA
jgi:phenylacetate-CoA ligase